MNRSNSHAYKMLSPDLLQVGRRKAGALTVTLKLHRATGRAFTAIGKVPR